jgi:hypothetical protein
MPKTLNMSRYCILKNFDDLFKSYKFLDFGLIEVKMAPNRG